MLHVSFTGHRPKELYVGTYTKADLIKATYNAIKKLIEEEGATDFYSGGAIGFDQIAFMCVHWLKKTYIHIKNHLVVPFFKQDKKWKPEQKAFYAQMKEWADDVIYVDTLDNYQPTFAHKVGEYSGIKMQLRNEYMVDHSHVLLAAYNGSEKSGTKNCLDYAEEKKKDVRWIDLHDNLTVKKLA